MSLIKANNGGRFLWISLLVIVIDQITKYLVVQNIDYGTSGIKLSSFFNLVHVYNTGAAFSFLADSGGWQRWFFSVVALVISAGLMLLLLRTSRHSRWTCISIALIIGGAIGNLIDRLLMGYVVDFLLFYLKLDSGVWSYPAFNVADIGVTIGACLLVLIGLFGHEDTADKKL